VVGVSLRSRVLLIIAVVTAVSLAGSYAVEAVLVLPAFDQIEEAAAARDIERCGAALREQVDAVARTCHDYAKWDDTYAYIEDPDPAYIESNFPPATFTDNSVDLATIVNAAGEVVWGGEISADGESVTALTDIPGLRAGAWQALRGAGPDGCKGVAASDRGTLLMAAWPITTSLGEGPARGVLVMGRLLDDDLLDELSQRTRMPFRVSQAGDEGPDVAVESAPCVRASERRPDWLTASLAYPDLCGAPYLLLSADSPRDASAAGKRASRAASFTLAAGALLGLLLTVVVLQRTVVGPVERLEAQVRQVGGGARLTSRVSEQGTPELARLAHEINRMLRDLQASDDALRDGEERMRSIFRATPAGLALVVDRRLVEVNQRLCDLLGYAVEEMVGQPSRMVYPDDDTYEYVGRECYGEISLTSVGSAETQLLRKDGEVIDVLVYGAALDPLDVARGVTFAALDITERKRAEAERERLVSAIDQAGEVIVLTDADGRAVYVNPAFESVTGYTREEALGQSLLALSGMGAQDPAHRAMWDAVSRGRTWAGQLVSVRKDGTSYAESATVSPVHDATGAVAGYVAVMRDISEYLAMREASESLERQLVQAQKMEAVGRLAGGIAHDFNNMLQAILGYGELALMETPPDGTVQLCLTEIVSTAQRSGELTQQLLAFARKQTANPVTLDLNELVDGTLQMLRRLIGENVRLVWAPGPGVWPVKVDPTQMGQVLANLVINARDAVGGRGTVTIETGNRAVDAAYGASHADVPPGEYAMVTVRDDGCGMDRETAALIFEPFFTTKEQGAGTGLGLSTVYGVVRQHGGFVDVESTLGEGSTFRVCLPRSDSEVPGAGEGQDDVPRGGTETILVVDDEATVLATVRATLERLGYTVLAAQSPEQALRVADEHPGPIALVTTDVVMPLMSGRELVDRLQAARPGLRALYMSGYTADVIAHGSFLDEGVRLVSKPFTVAALAAAVRDALDAPI
jgi:two-component system, cell cycle sensor histidine kinase and response regulator CckA